MLDIRTSQIRIWTINYGRHDGKFTAKRWQWHRYNEM